MRTVLPIITTLLLVAGCDKPPANATKPAAQAPAPTAPSPAPTPKFATRSTPAAPPSPAATGANAPDIDTNAPLNEQLQFIAKTYTKWTRVSDNANFAPVLCRAPARIGVQISEASSESEHARKLYFLFARRADDYPLFHSNRWYDQSGRPLLDAKSPQQPVGQVIVKESFHAFPATEAEAAAALATEPGNNRDLASIFARESNADGTSSFARIGEPTGLFIMLKVDPATPDTDNGWIYATTTSTGEVTSSGRVESCMNCHVKAPYDRLFGPKQWKPSEPTANPDPNSRKVPE